MQRIFNNKLWLAVPLALLMTGCWLDGSSSKNNDNGGVNPTSTDLAVTATTPADLATNVATSGNVTATFNQAMDPATITGTTFTLMAGDTSVVGEVTYAGTVATFNPNADLAANTLYKATITTGAKNVAGWSFTTGTVPTVTSTIPADHDPDVVALNRNVIAAFSEAMDAATLKNSTTFTLTRMEGDVLVPVPGEVTYAGTFATFNPTDDLAAEKEFTATITTAAKDLSGDALSSNVSWKFTTGTERDDAVPTVSSTSPADTQVDHSLVATNRNVTATFSETMDPATITATAFTVKAEGALPLVPGVVTYAGKIATFNPNSDLPANTILIATITTGAKDLAGNALAANVEWRFTTGAMADDTVPTVSVTAPLNNAASPVPANGNVTATFSEAMDPETINSTTINSVTFTLTYMNGETLESVPAEVTYAGLVATLNPTNSLPGDKLITATITTGVKDLVGNALANDYTWSFTTGAAGPAAVNLGKAGTFAILTQTGITDTDSHASVVTGDIGTTITGAAIGLTCPQVTGTIYSAVDGTGPLPCRVINPTLLTAAIGDMGLAYADAAARTLPDQINLGDGEIGGQTLVPGLYKWGMPVSISNDVTLSGGPNDVWIFQIADTLTMLSAMNVKLAGGAQAKNIFWQVAGDAVTIGASAHFEGIILAKFKIALTTGASVNGRLLAQTAATLQANVVTKPAL